MTEANYDEEILLRLNVIISLLLDAQVPSSDITISSKIQRLSELGLAPAQVGKIVGRETKYVSAVLSQRSKARRIKEKKNE